MQGIVQRDMDGARLAYFGTDYQRVRRPATGRRQQFLNAMQADLTDSAPINSQNFVAAFQAGRV